MTYRDRCGLAREYLECPCCGDDGAESDDEGLFSDGQALICGCVGHVSVDSETDPWINNLDGECPASAKCHGVGEKP